ncbi:hypothetical protein TPHA_0J03000 [Tetrapisispora phaffii CBS 4417]|uniref:Derlin n=1 Tax=Tetrapisispora phaffii (strain ATCC 24235 / CBS 4417 / NBRC 1672 / NRRL Y-8282 / UCD 70-5) TaxID=1071381 RepID=G8BY69_TETPH|nr:hypothetical protein TPHA_0J03000 [Tetrapisispora phaffii CBS 4417]CCE65120.1 hypothetical protein TPHA_0J03000 [Tetrapisispora phaffii CBS 4417]
MNTSGSSVSAHNWFQSIPPITRIILSSIVTLMALWKFSIIDLSRFVFSWHLSVKRFQFWRIFTSSIIIIPGGAAQALATILDFYNLYSRSLHLETVHFRNNKANYAYYIMCCMVIVSLLTSAYFQISEREFILKSAFSSCIGYTWAMDHKDSQILYFGFIPIKGKYYPVLEIIMSFVFNGGDDSFQLCVIGVLTGYIYECLDTKSFGRILWWLTNKNPNYYPFGYFKPPVWFVTLISIIDGTRITKFGGRGERLGNSNRNAKTSTIRSSKSNEKSTAEKKESAASRFATFTTERKNFPGKGQKLGK